jgi:two-component system LytT family response regulator
MQKSNLRNNSNDVSEISLTDFKEIIYCKAEGNYTRIYSQNKSILVTKVLKCFESTLPSDVFIRIHKTYIVNLDFIIGLKGNKRIILRTDIELPVSRRRRSYIIKKLSGTHLIVKLKV